MLIGGGAAEELPFFLGKTYGRHLQRVARNDGAETRTQ